MEIIVKLCFFDKVFHTLWWSWGCYGNWGLFAFRRRPGRRGGNQEAFVLQPDRLERQFLQKQKILFLFLFFCWSFCVSPSCRNFSAQKFLLRSNRPSVDLTTLSTLIPSSRRKRPEVRSRSPSLLLCGSHANGSSPQTRRASRPAPTPISSSEASASWP